jgi:cytochrome c
LAGPLKGGPFPILKQGEISMKRLLLAAALLSFGAGALAADGKAVFEAGGCKVCHDAKKDGIGPSLATIAAKYGDKKKDLVTFLEGTGKPVVVPEKFPLMKPSVTKTQALKPEERDALADFILSHKK